MNSVTLIGTVEEPIDERAFVLAVEHALVPVRIRSCHSLPAAGDRVVVEGSLHDGPVALRVDAATMHVASHHMLQYGRG